MKIKTKKTPYARVAALPRPAHKKPMRPSLLLATVIRLITQFDLWRVRFSHTGSLPKDLGPALVLMNHSSFIDLPIAFRLLYPRRFGIVCTSDGLVGKHWVMRWLGCISTQKFVSDISLIGDIRHTIREKKASVLMYPEASYSFDGTATPLPRRLGILLKKLDVPVVLIRTEGAFARDPLYNGLRKRRVRVSAHIEVLLTPQHIRESSVEQLDRMLDEAFTYDHFAWQRDRRVAITEPFRAEGLERILYRCPHCETEGEMLGQGASLFCRHCGKRYEMDEYGQLAAIDGDSAFSHIPDWYAWQRQEVRRQIEEGTYRLDTPVEIGMLVDFKAVHLVGSGRLIHDGEGFTLTGCGGLLTYRQSPKASYGLYADYFWYEIGDVICIGDKNALYYCFPPAGVPVAKARLAAEELYKLSRRRPAVRA